VGVAVGVGVGVGVGVALGVGVGVGVAVGVGVGVALGVGVGVGECGISQRFAIPFAQEERERATTKATKGTKVAFPKRIPFVLFVPFVVKFTPLFVRRFFIAWSRFRVSRC
jgi:hypothetical protein